MPTGGAGAEWRVAHLQPDRPSAMLAYAAYAAGHRGGVRGSWPLCGVGF